MSYKRKELSKIDSNVLVDYILVRGGAMSHLKLQKILFYVQAYHLAYFEQEIIDDDFEAWVHGPVSRKIYNLLKEYSTLYSEIEYDGEYTVPQDIINKTICHDQVDLINDVIDELKDLSGTELENMTHSETPWINARRGYGAGDKSTEIIPKESIKEYYSKLIYG